MAKRVFCLLALGTTLFGVVPSFARSAGHPGATGRPEGGTCNRCHSPATYDGAYVRLPPHLRRDCVRRTPDGRVLVEDTFFVLPKNETVTVELVVPEPSADDGLTCPPDTTCTGPVVGVDVEVTGLSATPDVPTVLRPAAGEEGLKQAPRAGGEEAGSEVVHNTPRPFEGGQARFLLEVDSRGLIGGGPITLYGSANACNGNGQADLGDITSTFVEVLYLLDESGGHDGPDCNVAPVCADGAYLDERLTCRCPDGTTLITDGDGTSPYCGATSCAAGGPPGAWAGLGLALCALAGVRRGRRRVH